MKDKEMKRRGKKEEKADYRTENETEWSKERHRK